MSLLSNGISKKTSSAILGGIALALTFGAVQFASGRDLGKAVSKPEVAGINRDAKGDRGVPAGGSVAQTRTVSFQVNSLPDTSVLLRLPMAREAANDLAVPPAAKSIGKPTLACEPMVSVLTEVAKQLQPGRCVT